MRGVFYCARHFPLKFAALPFTDTFPLNLARFHLRTRFPLHTQSLRIKKALSREPSNLSELRLVVRQVCRHQQEREVHVFANRFDDASAERVVHLHDDFFALAHAKDFCEELAVKAYAEAAFAVVRNGECFARIAADIRVRSAEFEDVAVELQADLAGACVGHRNHAADLVLEFRGVGLCGAFKLRRNHGAVARIRSFVQLRNHLDRTGVKENVRCRGADFDSGIALGHVQDVLQRLVRDDDTVRKFCAFLIDGCAAQTVTVGSNHGNLAILSFEEHTVQAQASGIGRGREQCLFGEECKFACGDVQCFAIFDFRERREVVRVKADDACLTAFAPLDFDQVILCIKSNVRDARVHEALHLIEQLACVDDNCAIAFALHFHLDPDTEVEVGGAHFEEVTFQAERKVIENLDGGLVRNGANCRLQGILQYILLDGKLHELAPLDDHSSYEKYNDDDCEEHDNSFIQRI